MDLLSINWLLISFLAPAFWAIVNICDVYFIKGIYKDEMDGTVMMSLFQILPCILTALFLRIDVRQFAQLDVSQGSIWFDPAILFALFGGVFFTLSFYFYFKALFSKSDAALLQIIWSLTVVVVPIFSYFIWGNQLPGIKYLGMSITLLGVILLSLNKKIKLKLSRGYLKIMAGAVLFLSFSMLFEDQAYTLLEAKSLSGNQSFLFGFMCFTLGSFLTGVVLALVFKKNPSQFLKKYWPYYIFLESVTFLGNISSQRAISIAPSVSYVATIETFVPVFILLFSVLISLVLPYLAITNRRQILTDIYQEQLSGAGIKIWATIVMAGGVYLLSW